jgi:tRNA1Val (adenine37-N6)-methyltransferase
MKVGTDAVLLGAWADIEEANRIVDAGCGSGIIALMAAQRNAHAFVTGLEIDPDAAVQAAENCAASQFNERIRIMQTDVFGFSEATFDHVVCNPPFHAGHVVPENVLRKNARHAVDGLDAWFRMAYCLSNEAGKASFVLPYESFDSLNMKTLNHGWHISRYCSVIPREGKASVRMLIELSKEACACEATEIQIETTVRGQYHDSYIGLVKDFYLNVD